MITLYIIALVGFVIFYFLAKGKQVEVMEDLDKLFGKKPPLPIWKKAVDWISKQVEDDTL